MAVVPVELRERERVKEGNILHHGVAAKVVIIC